MNCSKYYWLILLITVIPFLSGCKKDELHWTTVERIETGTFNRFNRILMPDSRHIIVCGGEKFSAANLFVSDNGGLTWQLFNQPQFGKGIYGATMAPNGQFFFTGFRDALLHTSDTGHTYNVIPVNENRYFIAAAFPTNTHGLLVSTVTNESGAVVHIDTAGHTLRTIDFRAGLNDVHFTDSLTGYLAGYGVMLKTLDGGYTWQYLDIHTDNFSTLRFLDNNTIYTCGFGGSIYRSTDAGLSWARLRNGDDLSKPRYHLQDILMLDPTHGYCVGESGLVIYTDDAGSHWSELDKFTSEDLHAISLLPSGNLLICGNGGSLYRIHP